MRSAAIVSVLVVFSTVPSLEAAAGPTPLLRTVDLNVGETQDVELADGSTTRVKLLDLQETRDKLRDAVRVARVKVEVNGTPATLTSAMYQLPVTVGGVQIDCSITRGLTDNSSK